MSLLQRLVDAIKGTRSVPPFSNRMRCVGHVKAVVTRADGSVKQVEEVHNLVTANGDAYLASLARVGASVWSVNAMKLGTATTAASKTGAGSFIGVGDYISGSAKACDNSSPKVGAGATITQWLRTYAAGEATNANINRVSIVDNVTDAGEADATHTLSTAVFANAIAKEVTDTLAVTWTITWLGA